MRNRIWVEAQLPYLFARLAIISFVACVGQQEFSLALGSVAFDRDDHSRTNEDAIVLLLGDYDAAFFNAEALAQLCRNDDCAAFSDSSRLHNFQIQLV